MSELLAKDLREGVSVEVDGVTVVGTLKVPPVEKVSLFTPVDDTVGVGLITPADVMDAVAKAQMSCQLGPLGLYIFEIDGGFPDTIYAEDVLEIDGGYPDTEYDETAFVVDGGYPWNEF